MEIRKDAIDKRLAELTESMERHIANANACRGAIQDCHFWLQVLSEKADKEGASPTVE